MYNIGLVVGNVEDDFSNQVCKGAMEAAQQTGDNLFIFPVKYLNMSDRIKGDVRQQYEYQYNFLLAYSQSASLDMVILCLSTISYRTSREESMKILESFRGIPVLLVASDEEGYSSVMYDNVSGLKNGIQYLIDQRNCKHICMFAGSRENGDAIERLETYKQVLAENGLVQTEDMISYGDFSIWCVAQAEELVEKNPNMDAVVCANDSMAKAMYQVLEKRSKQIGKAVCVLGFDDVEEAQYMEPPLATVRADAYDLGYHAMLEVHRSLREDAKRPPIKKVKIKTEFINRESSSGQRALRPLDLHALKREYQDKFQQMIDANHRLNILTRDMLMYCDTSEGKFSDFLAAFHMIENTSCYLFMLEKPVTYYAKGDFQVVENLYLQAYKLNDEVVEFCRQEQVLGLEELFRNAYFESKSKCYIIIDIYSREVQHGIMVCDIRHKDFSYVENLCYQISMATKIIDLLQIQEQLLGEKEEMLRKLEQENLILDDISNKDELTGINNRRGFITKAVDLLKDESNWGKRAAVMYVDLNYLKLINDRYSHAEGNYALQICAEALTHTAVEGGVAGRIGGDEFVLFTVLEEGDVTEVLRESVYSYLKKVNQRNAKPYEITASVGIREFVLKKDGDLKQMLKLADEKLYEEKKNKKPFVER